MLEIGNRGAVVPESSTRAVVEVDSPEGFRGSLDVRLMWREHADRSPVEQGRATADVVLGPQERRIYELTVPTGWWSEPSAEGHVLVTLQDPRDRPVQQTRAPVRRVGQTVGVSSARSRLFLTPGGMGSDCRPTDEAFDFPDAYEPYALVSVSGLELKRLSDKRRQALFDAVLTGTPEMLAVDGGEPSLLAGLCPRLSDPAAVVWTAPSGARLSEARAGLGWVRILRRPVGPLPPEEEAFVERALASPGPLGPHPAEERPGSTLERAVAFNDRWSPWQGAENVARGTQELLVARQGEVRRHLAVSGVLALAAAIGGLALLRASASEDLLRRPGRLLATVLVVLLLPVSLYGAHACSRAGNLRLVHMAVLHPPGGGPAVRATGVIWGGGGGTRAVSLRFERPARGRAWVGGGEWESDRISISLRREASGWLEAAFIANRAALTQILAFARVEAAAVERPWEVVLSGGVGPTGRIAFRRDMEWAAVVSEAGIHRLGAPRQGEVVNVGVAVPASTATEAERAILGRWRGSRGGLVLWSLAFPETILVGRERKATSLTALDAEGEALSAQTVHFERLAQPVARVGSRIALWGQGKRHGRRLTVRVPEVSAEFLTAGTLVEEVRMNDRSGGLLERGLSVVSASERAVNGLREIVIDLSAPRGPSEGECLLKVRGEGSK